MSTGPVFADSTTNLANAAVFTGTARMAVQGGVANYNNFNANFYSSHASAANGAVIQGSQDGSTGWTTVAQSAVVAVTPLTLSVPVTFPYYRVVLTNGATLTTTLSITSSFTL